MTGKQQFEVWREDVYPALASKVDEFQMLGYDKTDCNQVWDCVLYKLRKKKEFIHIHEFVSVILTLRVSDYMNWLTIAAYTAGDWFSNEENSLEELANDIK
ncbi:post-transcriptional regulator [Bacillus sp. FJAT-45350]|uniref:post-transcriptional regulator n=1 Tax=Bacillus sp. FJAT-45350 TaxID=2011014 RepID=UPI000BB7F57B|nr:post-transcriptional regulator [Bacillus sp. FJAT-45350]